MHSNRNMTSIDSVGKSETYKRKNYFFLTEACKANLTFHEEEYKVHRAKVTVVVL